MKVGQIVCVQTHTKIRKHNGICTKIFEYNLTYLYYTKCVETNVTFWQVQKMQPINSIFHFSTESFKIIRLYCWIIAENCLNFISIRFMDFFRIWLRYKLKGKNKRNVTKLKTRNLQSKCAKHCETGLQNNNNNNINGKKSSK